MPDRKIESLKQVALFADCSASELETLAENSDEVALKAGRTVIEQGKSNDTFFVVLEGRARVTIDGSARNEIGPGDVFGEISMLDRGPATATVETATPMEVLVMSHMQFRDAIRAQQDIATKVMAIMAKRLRESDTAPL